MNTAFTHYIAVYCCIGAAMFTAANASAESSSATRSASSSKGRIVVLGDSLATSPSKADSFPAQLQKRLEQSGLKWTVTNAGVHGEKTAGGLERFNAAVPADTQILILELGANDGLRGVAIPAIEKNLSTIIERAQARNIKVLLCGMVVPPRYGWDHAIAFHGLYPRLAAKYNVPLVPFLLQDVALRADMNLPDGVHPNAAGAKRIADTVWTYLQALVRG